MCGLVAAFTRNGAAISAGAIEKVAARLARRGPDGGGLWQGDGAILAHRRLAVIDLDSRSAQPMQSSCGRYRIVFNGEIYNFRELRPDLQHRGHVSRTISDNEVLLALFATEGQETLPELHGMFAFVIWASVSRRGFAARDACGIKPRYVARVPGGVVLASQVKALGGQLPRDPRLAIGQMECTIYLRNQLLRGSDWASMDHPLVDSHLLQQLQPVLGRFDRYPKKSLLARAPASELPVEGRQRRKTGFRRPVSRWMQGRDAPLSTGWAPHVAAAYQEAA